MAKQQKMTRARLKKLNEEKEQRKELKRLRKAVDKPVATHVFRRKKRAGMRPGAKSLKGKETSHTSRGQKETRHDVRDPAPIRTTQVSSTGSARKEATRARTRADRRKRLKISKGEFWDGS